jgi:queuine tRNA-ribosyltransferase
MFKVTKQIKAQRTGLIKTLHGKLRTPLFMPIATRGAVKIIEPAEIRKAGFEMILSNTYHLWMKPGDELIKKSGGLHSFINWDKPILTDSGGFQVFSLGEKAREKFGRSGVKISEEGVAFTNCENGQKYFMSPEKSIEIQLNLGSDIIMCLDECPAYPCDKKYAKNSLELTLRWAKRCKDYFEKNLRKYGYTKNKRPLLFGIVQGSTYRELREKSVQETQAIGFDGYAIGGVAVGEPREKLKDILRWTLPLIAEDKPRYLMGLGRPEELALAIKAGIDMFDCVIPTREGRHGRLFVWKKENLKNGFYQTINISSEKYKEDFRPVDENCECPLCKSFSRAYLRHLLNIKEPLGMKLASLHNLYFYGRLIDKMRNLSSKT